jgi:hypothetical protein
MAQVKRSQLFVDREVQRPLVFRVVMYWAACIAMAAMLLLLWQIVTSPGQFWYIHVYAMRFYFGPAAVVAVLLLPIIVIDVLRLSNRFVGPIVRMRESMRRLARGEHVEPLDFRGDDFWCQFAEEFNAVVALVQESKPEVETADEQPQAEESPVPCEVG